MGNVLGHITASLPATASTAVTPSTPQPIGTPAGEALAGKQATGAALSRAPARTTRAAPRKPVGDVDEPQPLSHSASRVRLRGAELSDRRIWEEVRKVLEEARVPASVIRDLKRVFDGLHDEQTFTCFSEIADRLVAEHHRLSGQEVTLNRTARRGADGPSALMAKALKKLTWVLTAQIAFQHLAQTEAATPLPKRTDVDPTTDDQNALTTPIAEMELLHSDTPAGEFGMNGPRGGTRTDSGQIEERIEKHQDDTLSLRDQIIWRIFSARRNFDTLPQVPRQDMTLKDWLVNGPSWVYLPYTHYSPTELAVAAKHFHVKPAVAAIRETLGSASSSGDSAARPQALPALLSSIPKAVYHAATAYLDLLREMKAANQEARSFRSDLAADPWVKNAYRHAYWMCTFAQKWSSAFASDLGYAHEYAHLDMTIEGPYDSVIDKINNLWGIKMANSGGTDCGDAVNRLGDGGHLAWAKDYRINEASGRHLPMTQNIQEPLDELWRRYQELPAFNGHDLEALRSLHVQLPGEQSAFAPVPTDQCERR